MTPLFINACTIIDASCFACKGLRQLYGHLTDDPSCVFLVLKADAAENAICLLSLEIQAPIASGVSLSAVPPNKRVYVPPCLYVKHEMHAIVRVLQGIGKSVTCPCLFSVSHLLQALPVVIVLRSVDIAASKHMTTVTVMRISIESLPGDACRPTLQAGFAALNQEPSLLPRDNEPDESARRRCSSVVLRSAHLLRVLCNGLDCSTSCANREGLQRRWDCKARDRPYPVCACRATSERFRQTMLLTSHMQMRNAQFAMNRARTGSWAPFAANKPLITTRQPRLGQLRSRRHVKTLATIAVDQVRNCPASAHVASCCCMLQNFTVVSVTVVSFTFA